MKRKASGNWPRANFRLPSIKLADTEPIIYQLLARPTRGHGDKQRGNRRL
jgi:hypothetical protein